MLPPEPRHRPTPTQLRKTMTKSKYLRCPPESLIHTSLGAETREAYKAESSESERGYPKTSPVQFRRGLLVNCMHVRSEGIFGCNRTCLRCGTQPLVQMKRGPHRGRYGSALFLSVCCLPAQNDSNPVRPMSLVAPAPLESSID